MIKKFLSMALAVALLVTVLPQPRAAEEAAQVQDYLTCRIFDGEMTVTDCDASVSGDITIPAMYDGQPITAIANYAFKDCTQLTSVVIPEGITSIGAYAFGGCTGLTAVSIPESVLAVGEEAFYNCESLPITTYGNGKYLGNAENPYQVLVGTTNTFITELAIHSRTRIMANRLFTYHYNLTSVTIPDSMVTVEGDTFANCSKLEYNEYGEGKYLGSSKNPYRILMRPINTSIEQLTTHKNTEMIAGSALRGCYDLLAVSITPGVTRICGGAFFDCTSLQTVFMSDTVTYLGENAFGGCQRLSLLAMSNNLAYIDNYAFNSCSSLQYITVPASVTYIGRQVFSECSQLKGINVSPDNSRYSYDRYGALLNKNQSVLMAVPGALTEYTVPDSVKVIDHAAFYGCRALEKLTVGRSVESIGRDAFCYCYKLKEIVFTGPAPEIDSSAFYNITTTANYPACSDSWTAEHLQNYSGTITWVAKGSSDGHTPAVVAGVAPTCTKPGLTEGKVCEICGTVLQAQEEIPVVDHTEAAVAGKAPTCTEPGLTEGKICEICGTVLQAQEEIPVVDHTEAAVAGKTPTCTEPGLTEGKVCEICGTVLLAQEEIPVVDHAWNEGVYTEPTTKADGYTTYTCTACGETRVETDEGTKLPEITSAAIVKQPEAVTTDSGNEVRFAVEASGDIVSWQWQYRKLYKWFNTSMEGYNTDTLTVSATGARNSYDYRCEVTFADGTVLYSDPAELTVKTYMAITDSPNDQVVVLGYKGQFTAAAEGEGLKYQWQYKRPNSDLWIDTAMEGATKATVMIETTTARNGYQYRCHITDVTGNEQFTEAATMSVLSFTDHPDEAFAPTGGAALFTVAASVSEGFTYQWQYRRSATANWTNTTLTGYNTETLTVGATASRNGYEYRCVLTGSKNSKIESKGAVLHVSDPVVISAQPESATAAAGEIATFTVEATNVYSYQWQYQRPSMSGWSNTAAEGNQTPKLSVTVKASNNGYKYRCVMFGLDGVEYYTDPAVLTVPAEGEEDAYVITAQPESVTAAAGELAQFTVAAKGVASYRWQYCKSGTSTWISTSMEGYDTPTLTVAALKTRNGYQYRCVLLDANNVQLVTDAATLTVGAVSIAAQPADYAGTAGQSAVFAVRAAGDDLTYQWQYRKTADGKWYSTSAAGNATDTVTVDVTEARSGYQYRCKITDAAGVEVYSRTATLTVGTEAAPELRITAQPVSRVASDTNTVVFATAATGAASYQWQFRRSASGTWTKTSMTGNQTEAITLPAKGKNGYEYRCIITDANGNQLITDEVILTVE